MSDVQRIENKEKIIPEMCILYDDKSTLFNKHDYIIPLYQRAFAWKDKEISQLIDDINDCETNISHYYLGSLIVSENKNGKLEVIDGQQRLTALYLLLNYLKISTPPKSLSYECRDNSNYTLEHLSGLLCENNTELRINNFEKIEDCILEGSRCIQSTMRDRKINECEFKEKLKKVRIYKIEVPKNTDLNRYFEIMNVRGEQLEQHDILKAKLMSKSKKQSLFAMIWDACSDMSGYVQMHFNTKNRESLFGYDWNCAPSLKNLSEWNVDKEKSNSTLSLRNILKSNKDIVKDLDEDYIAQFDNKIRFTSIMGFSYFLLHVLKVFVEKEKFDNDNDLISEQIDDKKLLQSFEKVMREGTINGKTMNESTFADKFIVCLLKCRFLFDKYIIKREYLNNAREVENGDDDGVWSLKELIVSKGRKPYYATTRLKKYIQGKTVEIKAEENLMLQSCLRVSFPSQKVSHWVTKLLKWLYDANYDDMTNFKDVTEQIAKESVNQFLSKENFRLGVETPHLVFNYLDYLLWTKRGEAEYKNLNFTAFTFEFRNSVEHWYPQHPSDQSFTIWNETDSLGKQVDRFGNLCLIQRNVNSKFSNLSPHSKYDTYRKMIEKGSLKLRIMSKTKNDAKWKDEICEKHEEEMLKLLKNACDSIPNMG